MTPDVTPEPRRVAATVHGRYLVQLPKSGAPRHWLVGFHGYGQNAEMMLELLRRIPHADGWLLASVQALHPFYNPRTNEVIANWMTRQDREHAIADNVAYVDTVVSDLKREFGAPAALVYAGFSQGVAMAYRAALLGHHFSDAIVAAGGDLPPELAPGPERPDTQVRAWPLVLIATGKRDEFYSPKRLEQEAAVLRGHAVDVRTIVFDGGHEWSAEVREATGKLLATIASGAKP